MGLQTVQHQTEQIVEILTQHGHMQVAATLQAAVQQLYDEQLRVSALETIQHHCHVKWLGDLSIPSLSWSAWWGMLHTLKKAVQRELKRLSPSDVINGL